MMTTPPATILVNRFTPSPESLSSLAAILLSLVFSYVPGLSSYYETLDGARKRLVMLGCLVLVSLASVGLACSSLAADLGQPLACTRSSLLTLANPLVLALVANQSTYLITPKRTYPGVTA